jgi:hypothetical protein
VSEVKVSNNVAALRQKFAAGIHDVTEWAADTAAEYAREEAPIRTGNLRSQIRSVWRNQYRKDAVSEAEYSGFVNSGHHTASGSFVPANPFWDRALERVKAEYVGQAKRRLA